MKKVLLFMALVLTSGSMFAQEKGDVYYHITFGGGSTKPFENHPEFSTEEGQLEMHYNFSKRLSASFDVGGSINLFEIDGAKDFYRTSTLGLGVGYNVIANSSNVLQVRTAIGNTVWSNDREYMYYEGGVRYSNQKYWRPLFIGVGVKYYRAQQAIFDNYLIMNVSLGFSF